jgi:beta-glucosidase
MRSVGAHHALAPVLDVTRDARWGRVEETFGEDPYLVARMGAAYVRGLQGASLDEGIVATGKHFVGYGASEGGLNWAPPHIAWREMREVYLFPFEAAVREAGLASMMNAYNELDGVPCGSSRELLTDTLRGQWGFDGTVVSDYFAVNQLHTYHHVARDKAEAALLALEAGIDVELPHTDCYGEPLKQAVEQGRIPMELLDLALRRALTQKFVLGVFENPYVDAGVVAFDTPEQRGLARQIAQKSMVLLKNDGNLLPLSKDLTSIAVIGPNADTVRNLFGSYAYPAHIETLMEMTREKNVFGIPIPDVVEDAQDFIEAISVLDAIKSRVSPTTQVYYAQGCTIQGESTDGFADAIEAASRAQVAVLVVGDKAGLTDDCTSGEARDRADLHLPGVQADLVKAVYETGTPVVLVLVNGRPVTLDWIAESVPAIVEAWFPSEEGANAIADVLFGEVNPGGKLPMTFPRAVGQIPIFYGHRPSGGRSHWKGDYVETSVKPLYPFGYGLSYTQFAYSDLVLSHKQAAPTDAVTISIRVKNVGQRAGDEVVQLYVGDPVASITRPLKALKGFKRITLQPGEQKAICFQLDMRHLAFYDRQMHYVVEPGQIQVMVGSSSDDIRLSDTFEITGETTPVEQVFFTPVHVE